MGGGWGPRASVRAPCARGAAPSKSGRTRVATVPFPAQAGAFTFADPYWTDISPEAKDLVKALLTVDPTKRITSEGVFEHPWIKTDSEALSKHLPHFSDNMKKYNLRRKFKGAVLGIMAKTRLSALFQKESS